MEDVTRIRKVIEKIQKLPTLPNVVQNVLKIVENPKTTAKDINRVISQDPALSSKVLRLVNSAFYGFPRRISTVTDAIIILGFNTVKSLALSASVFDVFKGESIFFDRTAFWQHSIGVGVAAQLIAKRVRYAKVEEIMIAGILHDIGKIALDQYAHEEFNKILATVKEKNMAFLEAEEQVTSCNHCDVGKWMADKWNFPQVILEPIAFHHFPEKSVEFSNITAMIHLADIICKSQNIGYSGDNIIPELNKKAWNDLAITKDDIEHIISELKDEIKKTEAFLSLARG
ncbi:MAG: HDOD domain-containing protein [Candidatus Hydrogenedentota bacterium]